MVCSAIVAEHMEDPSPAYKACDMASTDLGSSLWSCRIWYLYLYNFYLSLTCYLLFIVRIVLCRLSMLLTVLESNEFFSPTSHFSDEGGEPDKLYQL